MLKISKDGLKVKRRIPFEAGAVDKKAIDACTIYVENFPSHLTHREFAKLFARAGLIRNVTMPKFKNNFTSKGFAFVEFADEKAANVAIETFNNCVPIEFTDAKSPNYIHVQGTVCQLRVMPKHEWLAKKQDLKQIKQDIKKLCPATMIPEKRPRRPDQFEEGTLLRLALPAFEKPLTKQAMHSVAAHFGNPAYVDVREHEVILRFATKDCLAAFMAKVSGNAINPNEAFLKAFEVQTHTKVPSATFSIMSSSEVATYTQHATQQRQAYQEFTKARSLQNKREQKRRRKQEGRMQVE